MFHCGKPVSFANQVQSDSQQASLTADRFPRALSTHAKAVSQQNLWHFAVRVQNLVTSCIVRRQHPVGSWIVRRAGATAPGSKGNQRGNQRGNPSIAIIARGVELFVTIPSFLPPRLKELVSPSESGGHLPTQSLSRSDWSRSTTISAVLSQVPLWF